MVSLDVVSLFTKVPTDETLAVVWDKLAAEPSLKECTCIFLCEDNILLIEIWYVPTKKKGLGLDSPLSPALVYNYTEYFEEMALGSISGKPSMWLRYIWHIHSLTSSGRYLNITWLHELNPTIYSVHCGERKR